MKPHVRYWNNSFLLYPPHTLQGEDAAAFLRFSANYFQALAQRHGERVRLEVKDDRLLIDLSQAPRTLRDTRRLWR
jgi:hypothetical protein